MTTTPTWRRWSAGASSSSALLLVEWPLGPQRWDSVPPATTLRGTRLRGAWLLVALLLTGCSSASRLGSGETTPAMSGTPGTHEAQPTRADVPGEPGAAAPAVAPPLSGGTLPVDFPKGALDLLTESARDSCSICAERHRNEAFDQLDEVYGPGRILTSTPESRFVWAPGGENEITLTSYHRSEPGLTFRFHSTSDHLVGIAKGDFTEDTVVEQLLSVPEDAEFEATIEIVAYAYGNRATYLYSASSNHLQFQCRILEISED